MPPLPLRLTLEFSGCRKAVRCNDGLGCAALRLLKGGYSDGNVTYPCLELRTRAVTGPEGVTAPSIRRKVFDSMVG